ncbi:DUF881 domain-containing protein [Clostridium sp. D2Q-14]|uniref:DUF881 domain-containing protein n=1 Tax=Anaeromonas gelatinilytica TaxID=2683194 RepID=UPI00193B3572|nr:DUF881 domain-containing protein [Anaeromonas gelatinilytica]MBS4535408.1 DUF881 domain-containing protein [Anaeromonas gelatinilytica]
MKNIASKTLIVAVCVLLGIIISIQYKTVNDVVGPDSIPSQKNKELVNELARLEEEKEGLMNELTNLENKIKKYESEASKESDYIKELSEELEKYRMFSGYEEVEGPGVEIVINEPEINDEYAHSSSIVENYDYLLDIISYLNVTGSEAISINDLRYTSYSEMLIAGEHINFNNKPIGAPIKIKAIGPSDDIESALRISGGIINLMESYGFQIEIKKHDKLTIPRYTEIKELKYAKPISDDEE